MNQRQKHLKQLARSVAFHVLDSLSYGQEVIKKIAGLNEGEHDVVRKHVSDLAEGIAKPVCMDGDSGFGEVCLIPMQADLIIQCLCESLNVAHDELMRAQGCKEPQNYDWPEWSHPANSIRMAEAYLDKPLSKFKLAEGTEQQAEMQANFEAQKARVERSIESAAQYVSLRTKTAWHMKI